MLETTRGAAFIPGSNLRTPDAGAAWLFLLPRLALGRVVLIGQASASTLAACSRVAREVIVLTNGGRELRRTKAAVRKRALRNVQSVPMDAIASLPDGGAELIVIASARRAERLRERDRWPRIARLLRTDGVVYVESRGRTDRIGASIGGGGWLVSAGQERFVLAPALGEVRAAVPAGDDETVRALKHRGLWSTGSFVGIGGRIREIPLGPAARWLPERSAVLAGLGVSGWLGRPPLYLREIARDAGIDIDSHRWGMAAPGLYLSNKVLFLLFDRSSDRLDYVVKVTRDADLNGRLDNEWRALRELQARGVDAGVVPRPAFFGTSGRLAVLGQTGIGGRRFTDDPAEPGAPAAHAAVEWLTDFGAATKAHDSGSTAADHLRGLLERFTNVYELAPKHQEMLAANLEAIARSKTPFPAVFQHGDPGAWNLLVTSNGTVAFLDWESAETRGMPLWDLFHFMRSFGVLVARASGTEDRLRGFEQQYLEDGPLATLLATTTRRYCERVGVDPELVEPLFHMSWMHRALKESTRLPPDRLDRGHYLNLLRLCLDGRDRPALRRVFELDPTAAAR